MRNVDKKYHYLYKTTNLINNKYYYGMHSTNNLDDNYLGSGVYLRRAIRKYGKDNFKREIIKIFDTRDELIQGEIDLLTREILENKYCMNIKFGGDGGSLGMINVKDETGNKFTIFKDDPRFLSGELVGITKNHINTKDKDGNMFQIHKDDTRFLSGELVGVTKGKTTVKDENGIFLHIDINDPRYLSGELKHICKNTVSVKDKNNNYFRVNKDDSRYLSGELVGTWLDRKHSQETKQKMSEKAKQRTGEKNSSFGTCWITKDNENKKIKKEELDLYINNGWSKGRK